MVVTEVGLNVQRIRRSLSLTQGQFAERLGVTLLTVHRWESGKSRPQRIARERLRELEETLATHIAGRQSDDARAPRASTTQLDFAGNPDAVTAVAEAWRLAYGHQFNPAFASETARIDPLPHQRVVVYELMLRQEPLRFLLADDAGAGKTIMTGLYVREMLSRGRLRRVLIVPPAGLVGNWERELRTLFRLRFRIANGPTTVWKEPVPYGALDGNAVLRAAPEPIAAHELMEDVLPGAWKDGKTNGIALTQALSRSRGTALPWGLVRDSIGASAASRWLRLSDGSNPVNCGYEESGGLLLERPGGEPEPYVVEPPTGGAVLEGAQIQDLADLVPRLLAASAGADLRFHVRVALAGDLSRQDRGVVDMLLAEVSEDLKTASNPEDRSG